MKRLLLAAIGYTLATNKIGYYYTMPVLTHAKWRVEVSGCSPSWEKCDNDSTWTFYRGTNRLSFGTNSEGAFFVTIHK